MPAFWCPHPNRQVALPLENKLCSASLSRSCALFLYVQTCGGHSADTQKIFPFTVHKSLFRLISIEFMRMRESAGVSHTQNFARRFSVPHTDWQQLDSVPSHVPKSSLPWVTDMRTVAQYGFTGACADAAEAKALFDESCRAVETWLTSKGVANPNGNSTSEFQDGRTADFEAACQTCSFGAASRWALTDLSVGLVSRVRIPSLAPSFSWVFANFKIFGSISAQSQGENFIQFFLSTRSVNPCRPLLV